MSTADGHRSYPVHLQLRGRRALVVGAGRVATRKIERLLETDAEVHVVAREASAPIRASAQQGRLTLLQRPVEPADVSGCFLVIAATDDRDTNAAVLRWAKSAGALVSRVDEPSESDFTVPALVRGSHVEATVSTDGAAPSASRRLRRELARWALGAPDRFVGEVARVRRTLASQGLTREAATERLRKLDGGGLYEACADGDEPRIRALVARALGEQT